MLAAMPQNQAIGLGIAGGFAITTGTSSYPRKNITNRSIPKHISKEETKEKTNSFLFLFVYKYQRQSKEPEFNYPLHLGSN